MTRHYDMLTNCRVRLASSTGADIGPPVRLPAEILALAAAPAESKPYDFSIGCMFWPSTTHRVALGTEHKVLNKLEERTKQWDMVTASSREELEQNVLARMKSVTNADDETCISILKNNSYDLEGSIEAFLSKTAI